MVTPELQQALKSEREVYVTTYTQEGKPGTVPTWFVSDGERVYITTMPTSKKAEKIRVNPRIRLRVGSRQGPALEGTARFATEPEVWRRVAALFYTKYHPRWNTVEETRSAWEQGNRVLVEVTPGER